MPGSKPTTVSSEMKNKVWNVSLKSFVLKGLLKKFKGVGPGCEPGHAVLGRGGVLLIGVHGAYRYVFLELRRRRQEVGHTKARLWEGTNDKVICVPPQGLLLPMGTD